MFFARAGLGGPQIGILMALQPVTESVASVGWGMLADSRCWHRRIFLISSMGVVNTAQTLYAVSSFGISGLLSWGGIYIINSDTGKPFP